MLFQGAASLAWPLPPAPDLEGWLCLSVKRLQLPSVLTQNREELLLLESPAPNPLLPAPQAFLPRNQENQELLIS